MSVYLYLPPNQDHSYLIVSKNASLLSFQDYSSDITYIFSIDNETGTIYSSSIPNVDVFNSLDEAKNFLSTNFNDSKMNLLKLGSFLIGSSNIRPNLLLISVINSYEKVASIFNHDILKINNVCTYYLSLPLQNANFSPTNNNLSTSNFYFSPSLDLSAPFPYYYFNQINLKNNNFCFNESFLTEFIDNKLLIACVIVIKGFICSANDFIYITKFCICTNNSLEKSEIECEIILKKEVVESNGSSPQVCYYSHAWKSGPCLCLNAGEDKLIETKKYISNEIVSRFNIDKVHILEYDYSNKKDKILYDNSLKTKLGITKFVIQNVSEEQSAIQKLNSSNIEEELNISEIESKFNIFDSNHKMYSLFTVLNQNEEITCIQDFIYRFMSSDSPTMTSITTYAFLKKIYQIMKSKSSKEEAIEFAQKSFEVKKKLEEFISHKAKQPNARNYKKEDNDDYFINDPNFNQLTKKKFLLNPQHLYFSQNYAQNEIVMAYCFPEPFIICDFYFLVCPKKGGITNKGNEFLPIFIQYDFMKCPIFGACIPIVSEPTWLHYDFRKMIKNSYQCPYNHILLEPTSVVHLTFKDDTDNHENFTVKNIKIRVKRLTKHPFKFIIQGSKNSYFKIDKETTGVDFKAVKRSLEDLIKLNDYRIVKQYPRFSENNKLATNLINPWYYNLRSQLISNENNASCPICKTNIKKSYSEVTLIDEFDPLLLLIPPLNNDNNNKNIKICSTCAESLKNFRDKYNNEIGKFVLADNSNSISFSTKKWLKPLYFQSKQEDVFDLSRFFTVSNEPAYRAFNLYFFTIVNVKSIRIEIDNNLKTKDEIKIKARFGQDEDESELKPNDSPYIFEKSLTDKNNIRSITFTFYPRNVENVKFYVYGSISNTFVPYTQFENKNCCLDNIDFKNYISIKRYLFEKDKRIQTFKNISLSVLYGFYFKQKKLEFQARSIAICIETNSSTEVLFIILPKFEKDSIFYYPCQYQQKDVKQITILYLDCATSIAEYTILFNAVKK